MKDAQARETPRMMIRTRSRENFKNKYYQLSLSNIEESEHESSFTKGDFYSKKIEEKDVQIANLQERIKLLMAGAQI